MVNWLVPKVDLHDDGSVVLNVQVGGFGYGEWAEISGYIIQEDVIQGDAIQQSGTFVPFSAIQQVPVPDPVSGDSTVMVNVATAGLKPGKDVKVLTRVAEVQCWPTVLRSAPEARAVPGVTATWQARAGYPGATSRSTGNISGTASTPNVQVTASGGVSQPSVTVSGLQPGTKVSVTVEAVAPSEPEGPNA